MDNNLVVKTVLEDMYQIERESVLVLVIGPPPFPKAES
jgi:hypothetical protein